ncbi:MAG TPA: hypothetical protein DCS30_09605 [Rhizobiales bacterium]|nr:hypothetical protein [Hyphomicrobiales bacterium]
MEGPVSGWVPAVTDFLAINLPRDEFTGGWEHMFTTAYQIGCEALIALGYAEENDRGAVPIADPMLLHSLPRWDDICLAVLWLAEQRYKLSYRCADDLKHCSNTDEGNFSIVRSDGIRQLPTPNIMANGKVGPAYADTDVLIVLTELGLIIDGRWTDQSETVFWREQPSIWGWDITADRRFEDALRKAVDTLPADISKQIDRLVVISDGDIAASIAQHKAASETHFGEHDSNVDGGRRITPKEAEQGTILQRNDELDWIFFRRWRLSDGWLTINQAELALEIFHDPLAIQMRCAVIRHLYPEQPDFWQ